MTLKIKTEINHRQWDYQKSTKEKAKFSTNRSLNAGVFLVFRIFFFRIFFGKNPTANTKDKLSFNSCDFLKAFKAAIQMLL